MKANVTITRRSNSDVGKYINIEIKDEASGLLIVSVGMDMSEFSQCVTGLAHSKGDINRIADSGTWENIGKNRVVDTAFCEKSYNKERQRQIVAEDFSSNYEPYGWQLFSDGTTTQQTGKMHKYIVRRFEEAAWSRT